MTQEDQATWHKALVVVFRKLGIVEMLITDEDIEPLNEMKPEDMPAIIMDSHEDGLHVRLATVAEAREYSNAIAEDKPKIHVPSEQKIVLAS